MNRPVLDFYSWRVHAVIYEEDCYFSDFNPMTDEFDVFAVEFDIPEVAVNWLREYFGGEEIPDNYRLMHFTGKIIPFSTNREEDT